MNDGGEREREREEGTRCYERRHLGVREARARSLTQEDRNLKGERQRCLNGANQFREQTK